MRTMDDPRDLIGLGISAGRPATATGPAAGQVRSIVQLPVAVLSGILAVSGHAAGSEYHPG